MTASRVESNWGASFRLVAAEKWKAKSAAMGQHVTQALVNYAQPQTGMRVLDLASGTGEPAITIASRIGPHGHITASDLSSELLEITAGRARQRGLTNLAVERVDAHHLPFADESFDLITSRFGVMFFEDGIKALEEARRVLKPGARACFLAWGPFEQPYWESTIGVVVKYVAGPALAPGDPDPFKFSQSGSLSSVLKRAGFSEVDERTVQVPWVWPGSTEEVWEYIRTVSMPFRRLLDSVPAQNWAEINRDVHEQVNRYREGDSIKFGAVIVLASGRKS